jgi:EKC/KEOPS complex subunit CGI121/TPRKB
MSLETIALEHVPPTHRVHVAFFRSVSNAAFLQSQLLARNPAFEYAFIDAAAIVSRLQLLAAVFRAVTGLLDGNLKTPNVHSEIVCSLSASNNVRAVIHLPFPPLRFSSSAGRGSRRLIRDEHRSQKPTAATA